MKDIHGKDDTVPGDKPTMKQGLLCAGGALLGKFDPINQICNHIVGFHFYSGEIDRQVIAHHYCSRVNKDMFQCIVYDSDKADAKLIGVEYIISEDLFKNLPEDEKRYWHSHVFEVKGGLLSCPKIPYTVEKEVMKEIIRTYGKTYHFWQVDRGDKLPLGEPKLMMSFSQDGQCNPNLIKARDDLYKMSTVENIKQRADIETPAILEGADGWKKGKATVLEPKEIDMKYGSTTS